jgi:dihydrofolate reductase
MTKLIYVTNVTLDGYIEDERGTFDLFPVDAEVFRSTTNLLLSAGTFLYGRRLYETMAVWETDATLARSSDGSASSGELDERRVVLTTRRSGRGRGG